MRDVERLQRLWVSPIRSRISARWLCRTPGVSELQASVAQGRSHSRQGVRQLALLGREERPARVDPGQQVGCPGSRARARAAAAPPAVGDLHLAEAARSRSSR